MAKPKSLFVGRKQNTWTKNQTKSTGLDSMTAKLITIIAANWSWS